MSNSVARACLVILGIILLVWALFLLLDDQWILALISALIGAISISASSRV